MKKGIGGLAGVAVLACGAGFMAAPALARCGKDCKTFIRTEFKSCRAACDKDKTCKQGCKAEKKADTAACKAAARPTPPNCGGTDDEGATTTTLGTATTTTLGTGTTTTTMGPTTHTVHVGPASAPLTFAPASLTIKAGDTVQWVWDSSGHDVVSGTNCSEDGTFCSPSDTSCVVIQTSLAGAMYQHTFTTAGTFPYFCAVHCTLGMTGSITVP